MNWFMQEKATPLLQVTANTSSSNRRSMIGKSFSVTEDEDIYITQDKSCSPTKDKIVSLQEKVDHSLFDDR